MPSPIGHALAGAAVAWGTEAFVRRSSSSPFPKPSLLSWLTLWCAVLAAAPDLDLLLLPIHRSATHSFAAILTVMIVAALVTGWVTGRVKWATVVACGVAWGSHLLLDWLADDPSRPRGIQMLWPFSDAWFISEWVIFPRTERRDPLSFEAIAINLKAAGVEVLLVGSLALACWGFVRSGGASRRRSRDRTSGRGGPPPPSV
jgi:membrane-bound metal-dependent hydrolase YbcI (DUF457 family)